MVCNRVHRGFTLIELLVVVAIAGTMAALVVLPMARWFGSAKQRAEVAEIHTTVQHGINMAILKAQSLQLEPQSALRTPWQWPEGWRLSQGQVDITPMGYCKGGELVFSKNEDSARMHVQAGSCAVKLDTPQATK